MPVITHNPAGNDLLESLSAHDKDRVLARCGAVELDSGTRLCDAGQSYDHAWFPLTALISQGSKLRDHSPLEMGLIGREGMLGATLALGIETAPLRAVVTVAGTALRMRTADLQAALHDGHALRQLVDHYLYIALAQLAQTAACNRFHAIEPRLARCLLTATDRAVTNHIHLTHESLAAMLGVRRSGITVAARALCDRGLIRYSRGHISILDREGLQTAACTCYEDWPSRE